MHSQHCTHMPQRKSLCRGAARKPLCNTVLNRMLDGRVATKCLFVLPYVHSYVLLSDSSFLFLSVRMFVCVSACLFVCSFGRSFLRPSVRPSARHSFRMSVPLSLRMFVHMFARSSVDRFVSSVGRSFICSSICSSISLWVHSSVISVACCDHIRGLW